MITLLLMNTTLSSNVIGLKNYVFSTNWLPILFDVIGQLDKPIAITETCIVKKLVTNFKIINQRQLSLKTKILNEIIRASYHASKQLFVLSKILGKCNIND